MKYVIVASSALNAFMWGGVTYISLMVNETNDLACFGVALTLLSVASLGASIREALQ